MELQRILEIIIEIINLINKGIDANKAISTMSIKYDISETTIRRLLKI